MPQQKTLVVVAGPTAVGKTAISIQLAEHYKTSILSFDSRQCYRELNIGVAKPSDTELGRVPHYFINSHSIHEAVDAAVFEKYALQTLEQLFAENDIVIATGGTGLYLKALCDGIDAMPTIAAALREQLRTAYERQGMPWLKETLATADPVYFANGETENPHRMLRALEVVKSTGQSIRHFQQNNKVQRPFTTIKTALQLPRQQLIDRIHQRVDHMMDEGLIEEAKTLYPFRHLQALQTVGYTELFDYFENKCSLSTAVENIKTHTRQYAKRQMTWFRKDTGIYWFENASPSAIIEWLQTQF